MKAFIHIRGPVLKADLIHDFNALYNKPTNNESINSFCLAVDVIRSNVHKHIEKLQKAKSIEPISYESISFANAIDPFSQIMASTRNIV